MCVITETAPEFVDVDYNKHILSILTPRLIPLSPQENSGEREGSPKEIERGRLEQRYVLYVLYVAYVL